MIKLRRNVKHTQTLRHKKTKVENQMLRNKSASVAAPSNNIPESVLGRASTGREGGETAQRRQEENEAPDHESDNPAETRSKTDSATGMEVEAEDTHQNTDDAKISLEGASRRLPPIFMG